jgi:L-iditol 2-dehydrogenase
MKALMKTEKGIGHFEVRDIPVPAIKAPDEVLIKVSAAGVCGTDVHIYHDMFQNYPPVVLGHEFSGIVEAVGKNVSNFKPGDRVVGEPHTLFCGVCTLCRAGKIQLCAQKRSPGWGIDGAFTDYLVMPDLFLHHVPDQVPDNVAALAEPMAIVTHSVLERGRVEPQDVIAVIGAGPIGLLSAVAAKAGGASKVIVLGTDADEERRFPAARKLGIDCIVNVMHENAPDIVNGLTKGEGADMVVEASGSEAGINTAIDIVKRCGRLCVIGMPGRDRVSVQWLKMIKKVLDVNFNLSSSVSSWERALSIMAHTPSDLSAIITHYADIQDWKRVFDDIEKGNAIKAFFIPQTSPIKEMRECASV